MKKICLFLLLCFSHWLEAQHPIDSIVQNLNVRNVSVLTRQLWQSVDHSFLKKIEPNRSKWDEKINLIAEKLVAGSQRYDPEVRAIILAHMAEVMVREKTGGPGYSYIQRALNLVKDKKTPAQIFTYYKYARIFQDLNRLDSAIFYAEKTLDMARTFGSDSSVKESLSQMADLCYKSRNFAKAEVYFKKLAANFAYDKKRLKGYLNTIGLTFRGRQLYDSARFYFNESLAIAKELRDTTWIGLLEGNIGHTYFLQKDYEKAMPGLLMDVKYSILRKNKMSAVSALNTLLEVYLIQNKLATAKKYYDTLNRFARGEQNEDVRIEYYKSSADFYQKIGKPDSAIKYLQLYVTLNNNLTQEEFNLNAAQLEAQFEFDRQINQIKELEKFNEAQAKENRMKNYFLLVTTALVVLGAIFIYAQFKTNRFRNQTNLVLKNQNEQIALQASHLNELNATKDKLFAIIGHDLRSPINSLKGLMSMVKNQMISRDEFETFLIKLQNSVDQVHLTLNNLLHWSGGQLNGLTIKSQSVEAKKLAAETLDLLHEQATAKNITLINELEDNVTVMVDPDHLRLIFRNLISNAIKFTNPQGSVRLTSNFEDGKVVLSIQDTGVGMTRQTCEKIFSTVATQSTSGTSGEKGTGLGLLLCKEVIERNGGSIWAESELGHGSTMKVSLPRVVS